MYENYSDRNVSLAHREAVRLVFEDDGRFFKIAASMLVPGTEVTGQNVSTPCCFWAGKHYPKNNPVLLAARTSQHGISVARYLWMVKNQRVLDPKAVVYHLCGNRRCVAPDHLFTAPNMAVVIGRLKAEGIIQKCIRDGVLYRIWHESGNHGYLATPPEWMLDYESEPIQEHDFNVVEWAAGILKVPASEVLNLMTARTERHRPRVDPMTEEYRLYKKHGATIMASMHDGDPGEDLLDMDVTTLNEWAVASDVIAKQAMVRQDKKEFGELSALCVKLRDKLRVETTGMTTRRRLDRDGWPVVPDEGPCLELTEDIFMEG